MAEGFFVHGGFWQRGVLSEGFVGEGGFGRGVLERVFFGKGAYVLEPSNGY